MVADQELPEPGEVEIVEPLNSREEAEAERVARRLSSELRTVIGLLPEPERGASAMSRALELDRATCQRLVAAARQAAGAETLVQMPGVQGLRQFLVAMARRTTDVGGVEKVVAAQAAVDNFEELINHLGGSQRKLRARLAAQRSSNADGTIQGRGGADDIGVRRALFKAAAAATGRWSDTMVYISLTRPVTGLPDKTEAVSARALLGHQARPDAVPLEVGFTSALREPMQRETHEVAGMVLEDFCTSPYPRVVSKSSRDAVVHVIDIPAASEAHGVDVVVARPSPTVERHPATMNPPIGELWNLINVPARKMIFDVYLHRDIARRCIPSVELHLWSLAAPSHVRARWSSRFAGGPRMELLGAGTRSAASLSYSRNAELTARLFALAGWNADEFVGYRCEVQYPLWRAGYCMEFDFSGNELAGT